MTHSMRLGLISGLIVAISLAVATTTILTLYRTAIEQASVRLVETVQSQAALIEAIADFNRGDPDAYPGSIEDVVLDQLRRAHEAYTGFGVTGEFTLATLRHGQIQFLLRHRHDTADSPAPIPLYAALAEPMQAALAGESTTLIGLDYRGERVLAATEPVDGLGWGLVAKIDLSEVQAPFRRAGLLAIGVAAALTAITVLLSYKLTSPFVERLRAGDRERLRLHSILDALVHSLSDAVFIKDLAGRYVIVNPAFCAQKGKSETAIIGSRDQDLFDPESARHYRRSDERAQRSGKVLSYEEEGHIATGETRQFLTTKGPLIIDGEIQGVFAIVKDITKRKRAENALAEREQRLRAIFDQAAVGIARVDLGGRWLEVNDKLCAILGQTREALLAKTDRDLRAPEDLDLDQALVQETLNGERDAYALDLRYNNPKGEPLWVRLSASLVRAEDQTPLYFITVIEDIDARKKAEEKLREAAAVFRSTGEGVVITDAKGKVLDVNDAFTRITGYSRDEVIGRNSRLFRSGRHDVTFYRDMHNQLQRTGSWNGEIWNRTKQGRLFPSILNISAVQAEDGQLGGYVGVFADVSSLKVTEARLAHLAHHDPLTDLPNRLLFRDRLLQSLARSKRRGTKVAVLFFDLDRFKNINDTLGHGVGDGLLVQVARRVQPIVRAGDSLGRISGDEFCLVAEDLGSAADASSVVEKLSAALSDPFTIENHLLRVSASIGVAIFPDHSEDADALLSFADAAMYEAKEAGRNTYRFYTQAMTEQALEHRFVQSALRGALEQAQFYLVYQPQIELLTGTLVGLEALVRWHHPERGLIPPLAFIHIAEQSGRINELGAWILCSACRQARAWLDEGHDLGRLFVNVAGPQLHDAKFPSLVRECLARNGLPAERLGLEVTETFVMRAPEQALDVLAELREMGIELAIDDFGTGYSSLSYLKQLPINKLKIDQSFVRDIPADKNDVAITEAIVAMGQALDLSLIAEGIEQPDQAELLVEMGCLQGQGYLYSAPLTPGDLIAWIDQRLPESQPQDAASEHGAPVPSA